MIANDQLMRRSVCARVARRRRSIAPTKGVLLKLDYEPRDCCDGDQLNGSGNTKQQSSSNAGFWLSASSRPKVAATSWRAAISTVLARMDQSFLTPTRCLRMDTYRVRS